jgi:hypothetical protein
LDQLKLIYTTKYAKKFLKLSGNETAEVLSKNRELQENVT